jgi:purine-nucleoside phosphorylase
MMTMTTHLPASPGPGTTLTPELMKQLAEDLRQRYKLGTVHGLLVAGSGLSLEIPGWAPREELALDEVLPIPMHHLQGHSHTLTLWRRGDETLLVMNGRLHLYQGYDPAEVVAPVRLAGLLGARLMIATNASGALDPTIEPGALVLITDHVNLQGRNPLVGEWGRSLGPQFPDMSTAYDPELRQMAHEAADRIGIRLREGVYMGVLGPSFETPAEVRMLAQLGGTLVGMSTVPEVIAARHMGLRVLAISHASNLAAGLTDQPLTHQEVLENGRKAAAPLRALLGDVLGRLLPG